VGARLHLDFGIWHFPITFLAKKVIFIVSRGKMKFHYFWPLLKNLFDYLCKNSLLPPLEKILLMNMGARLELGHFLWGDGLFSNKIISAVVQKIIFKLIFTVCSLDGYLVLFAFAVSAFQQHYFLSLYFWCLEVPSATGGWVFGSTRVATALPALNQVSRICAVELQLSAFLNPGVQKVATAKLG